MEGLWGGPFDVCGGDGSVSRTKSILYRKKNITHTHVMMEKFPSASERV